MTVKELIQKLLNCEGLDNWQNDINAPVCYLVIEHLGENPTFKIESIRDHGKFVYITDRKDG